MYDAALPCYVVRRRRGVNPEKKTGGAWSYIGIGSQMVAATFVGAGIGWWLDRVTGWSPVFLVIFFLLGSAAGFIAVYRAFQTPGGRSS